MSNYTQIFTQLGAQLITDEETITKKMRLIKAFIFDWDGVFNNGQKTGNGRSNFSEVDSMGTNLLRYSYFSKNNQLPLTAVISGEKNDSAFYFCERECFNYSFFKIANKIEALNHICKKENIQSHEVAYFFDDVLDLSMAEVCGIRILINQKANPLFTNYCIKNNLVDYLTASQGGQFAVREASEFLIALNGNYDEIISNRRNSTPHYKTYIDYRKKTKPTFQTIIDGKIEMVTLT